MRIAISDYDGTLKQNGTVAPEDVDAINCWRESGNMFGIATGRDLGMTIHETDMYSIPFDFLVCLNGCVLYDGDQSIISATEMDKDLVPAIVAHPASRASLHIALMNRGRLQICFNNGRSWFVNSYLPHTVIDATDAANAQHVMQISLGYPVVDEAAAWAAELNKQFAGQAVAHHNANTIDINSANTDKALGIRQLITLKGWQDKEVLVLGDGGNDVGMISAFHGYTLHHGTEELKRNARGIVGSLSEMLEAGQAGGGV